MSSFIKQQKNTYTFDNQIDLLPISVIICAKNESTNLSLFLPAFLEQDYPADYYELIVVDDASTDDTPLVLAAMKKRYAHLRIITIPHNCQRDLPGKKFALSQAVAAAKNEILVMSDADCRPSSKQWLKQMTNIWAKLPHHADCQLVLGYGAYKPEPGPINALIRWETFHTFLQYATAAILFRPYMGVGRNIAYQRSFYLNAMKNKGFLSRYKHIISGDDDLIVSRFANKSNTSVCTDNTAHTISIPPKSWKEWLRQKSRHVGTGKSYPFSTKLYLGAYAISHCLFWLFIPFLLFSTFGVLLAFGQLAFLWILVLGRFFVYFFSVNCWGKVLGENKTLFHILILDAFWAIYNVILSPYIFWRKKKTWK